KLIEYARPKNIALEQVEGRMSQADTGVDDGVLDVVIIGAGFGGLGMSARLLEAGFQHIVVLERAMELGGVWRENRYPNIACDTPIDLYAFSFYPGGKWTTNFAPGAEILDYMGEFADFYGVTPRI